MFCGQCGTKLPDNAKFCFKCGNKVVMLETPVSEAEPVIPEVKEELPVVSEVISEIKEEIPEVSEETPIISETVPTVEDILVKADSVIPVTSYEEGFKEAAPVLEDTVENAFETPIFEDKEPETETVETPLAEETVSDIENTDVENILPEIEIPEEPVPEISVPEDMFDTVMPEETNPVNEGFINNAQTENTNPWFVGNDSSPEGESYNQNNNAFGATGSNEFANQAGASNEYFTAEEPEVKPKKKKRKRNIFVSIICGFFTFIFSLVLFASVLTLFSRVLYGEFAGAAKSGSASSAVELSKIQVGGIVNEINKDDDKEYDEDITVAEFIYENLSKKDKEDTSVKDIEKLIDDSSIGEFITSTINDYMLVAMGQKDEVSITTEDILELVEDNEDLISDAIGRDIKKSDYKTLEKKLDNMKLEKNSTFKGGIDGDNIAAPVSTTLDFFFGNPVKAYVSIGILIGIISIIIILFNLHKPYVILLHLGISSFVTGLIGLAGSLGIDIISEKFLEDMDKYGKTLQSILGSIKSNIMFDSLIFGGVGLGLIIIYAIINIIVKAVSSRREEA